MKRVILCLLLVTASLLSAEHRLLVDCVHGVDFYGDGGLAVPPATIDFQAAFPEWTIVKITPDSLPIDHDLYRQEVTGSQVFSFIADLPQQPDQALYAVVSGTEPGTAFGITGEIHSPQGELLAQAFNGAVHADLAAGSGYQVLFNLPEGTFDVHIGYGRLLFTTPDGSNGGRYCPLDFETMLRVKDNSYYALTGDSPFYSESDLETLGICFGQGLSFLHYWAWNNSVIDKPFVHFDSDHPLDVDYSVRFPGRPSLLIPQPTSRNGDWTWNGIPVDSRGTSEILYEGKPDQSLGFLACRVAGSGLILRNLAPEPLHSLRFVKYENGRYLTTFMESLEPGMSGSPGEWTPIGGFELDRLWREEFRRDALAVGLTPAETGHFVDELPWIPGLMHRAYENPGVPCGLYRFDRSLYDRLLPCSVTPEPQSAVRSMWVMLSNIRETTDPVPIALDTPQAWRFDPDGPRFREYGVTDEYYTLRDLSREEVFFGMGPYSDIMPWQVLDGTFYNNDYGDFFAVSVPNPKIPGGYFLHASQPEQFGIMYANDDLLHPTAVAAIPSDYGRLIGIGSSNLLKPDEAGMSLATFSRRCLDALMDPDLFPVSAEPPAEQRPGLMLSPNPCHGQLTLEYSLPVSGTFRVVLYNIRGQQVRELVRDPADAGVHTVVWDGRDDRGRDCPAGVYMVRIAGRQGEVVRKAVLLR